MTVGRLGGCSALKAPVLAISIKAVALLMAVRRAGSSLSLTASTKLSRLFSSSAMFSRLDSAEPSVRKSNTLPKTLELAVKIARPGASRFLMVRAVEESKVVPADIPGANAKPARSALTRTAFHACDLASGGGVAMLMISVILGAVREKASFEAVYQVLKKALIAAGETVSRRILSKPRVQLTNNVSCTQPCLAFLKVGNGYLAFHQLAVP